MRWPIVCSLSCAVCFSSGCARPASGGAASASLAVSTASAERIQQPSPGAGTAVGAVPEQESPLLKAVRGAKLAYADGRLAAAWLAIHGLEEGTRLAWQQALLPLGPRTPAGFQPGDEPGRISGWSDSGVRATWYFTGAGQASLSVHVDTHPNPADKWGLGTHPWLAEGTKAPREGQELVQVKGRTALFDRESGGGHVGLALWLADEGILFVEGWDGPTRDQLVAIASALDLAALDTAAKRALPAPTDAPAAFDAFSGALKKQEAGRAYVARTALDEKIAALVSERLVLHVPREVPGWKPAGVERAGLRTEAAAWNSFTRGENQEFSFTLRPMGTPDEDGRRAALLDPAKRREGDQVIDFRDRKALWRNNELFVHFAGDRFVGRGHGWNVDPNEWIQALSRVLDPKAIDAGLAPLQ